MSAQIFPHVQIQEGLKLWIGKAFTKSNKQIFPHVQIQEGLKQNSSGLYKFNFLNFSPCPNSRRIETKKQQISQSKTLRIFPHVQIQEGLKRF